MAFYIDLKKISIKDYKEKLKKGFLLPSRETLRTNIDINFDLLKKNNISNLQDILDTLKNKNKLKNFSEESDISEEYLTILVREVKSYLQKPVLIKDFPDTQEEVINKLEVVDIKNVLQLYDKVLTIEKRKQLSEQTGIEPNELLRLAKLADLTRIKWVGHTFAYVLYEAGYDTSEKVAKADYNQLYEDIKKLNEERNIYKGNIGLNDMNLCVEAAKELDFELRLE